MNINQSKMGKSTYSSISSWDSSGLGGARAIGGGWDGHQHHLIEEEALEL